MEKGYRFLKADNLINYSNETIATEQNTFSWETKGTWGIPTALAGAEGGSGPPGD